MGEPGAANDHFDIATPPNPQETTVKIVEIREKTIPISSAIRNAYIDFSKMNLSLVAVVTDVIRDGRPVVGYGFNSNGRYGQGSMMRERFIPRILETKSEDLIDASGNKGTLSLRETAAATAVSQAPAAPDL